MTNQADDGDERADHEATGVPGRRDEHRDQDRGQGQDDRDRLDRDPIEGDQRGVADGGLDEPRREDRHHGRRPQPGQRDRRAADPPFTDEDVVARVGAVTEPAEQADHDEHRDADDRRQCRRLGRQHELRDDRRAGL